jgi:hypothetical protein
MGINCKNQLINNRVLTKAHAPASMNQALRLLLMNLLHAAATKKPINRQAAVTKLRSFNIFKSPIVIEILVLKVTCAPTPCNEAITDCVEKIEARIEVQRTAATKAAA